MKKENSMCVSKASQLYRLTTIYRARDTPKPIKEEASNRSGKEKPEEKLENRAASSCHEST